MTIGYVQIWKFCELTGYTEDAVRTKIKRGVWLENRVWRKAPDGHTLIHMEGFWLWAETGMVSRREDGETESEKRQNRHTKSPLPFGQKATSPRGNSSPSPIAAPAARKVKNGQR
ncbi:excisionase [Nitrosospira sp. Nsp1]|uniref:excisionase n=1 Tax=Nitrosospira sp. Nsp1 TaxID=136547 RepID=UPI00088AD2AC|nr:excisionase [Nitrosospira sp. Nsp1]SCX59005.1 hypothetical protein SAMN05720354_12232 [Nitrosospira sp. Nsp1]